MSTYSRPQVPAGSCGAISLRLAGRDLLKPISKMDQAFYFLQPVDVVALRIPDYPTIVREPMDLGTIEKKLDASSYATTEEFVADVKLVWYNARLYNPVGSVVHEAARALEKAFDDRLEALVGSCDRPAPPAPDSDAADGVPASKLRPLLRSLQSHARSKPFRVPVDYVALNLPHYPTIITQPMDLATVSSNLERGRYGTVADLRRDIDLIWQNAIDFNGPTSWIGVLATTLREITEHEFSTSIGRNAFAGCSCLNDVSFSAGGRTSIDGGAFYGCSLTRVTVPTTAKVGGDAFPSTTTVLRLPPAKMRWYAAVGAALAYKRCRSGLLLWLERANIRLGSYGPEGAARKRDREEFECDFAPSQEQDGSCSGVQDLSREGN